MTALLNSLVYIVLTPIKNGASDIAVITVDKVTNSVLPLAIVSVSITST